MRSSIASGRFRPRPSSAAITTRLGRPRGHRRLQLPRRTRSTWTANALTPDHRTWLAALPQGTTLSSIDLVEICHGAPFDEDVYIFDDLDAMRALHVASARSVSSVTRTCRPRLRH